MGIEGIRGEGEEPHAVPHWEGRWSEHLPQLGCGTENDIIVYCCWNNPIATWNQRLLNMSVLHFSESQIDQKYKIYRIRNIRVVMGGYDY